MVTLGVTTTASFGILSYAFAAFITPMGAELGWSKVEITGAFSLAQLVAGIAAIPVGQWVDRHGARALMTAGSILAALLLVAWSGVRSLPGFYAISALMGVATAAVLYEPAFAVIANWFERGRSRALTVLTFMAGFATVIFVPLAASLVARYGWRSALLWLAGSYALLTVLPHALVLRRRPEDLNLAPDGASDGAPVAGAPLTPPAAGSGAADLSAREVIRSRSFRRLVVAFTLSGLANTAVAVHFIPLLVERGYELTLAGGAMGVLGLMALPGRLIFTPLGDRWRRSAVTASLFVLQALGLAALLATRSVTGIWAFVVLFGVGLGAITPARAALVGELAPALVYGQVSGLLAFSVAIARAVAPLGASLLYVGGGRTLHGYDLVLAALLLLCAGSAATVRGAVERRRV